MSYGKLLKFSWTWPTSCTTLWTDSRCRRRLWWPNTSCPGKCRAKCKTWTGSNLWAVCICLSCQMALNTAAISWKLFSNFNRIKFNWSGRWIGMEAPGGLWVVPDGVSPCGRTACSPPSSSSCAETFRADGGTKSPDRVPCSPRCWRTDQSAAPRASGCSVLS